MDENKALGKLKYKNLIFERNVFLKLRQMNQEMQTVLDKACLDSGIWSMNIAK